MKQTRFPVWSILLLTLTVLGIALFYQAIWLDIAKYSFDDGTYSHAYLIPFVCIYVVYLGFKEGSFRLQAGVNSLAIIASVFCAAIVLFSYIAQFPLLARAVFPLLVFSLFWTLLRCSLELVIVCALLWFVTPVWGPLVAPLQALSVTAVDFIMGFVSIPSYIEGNMVTIAVGQFEIAGGCSGLRYFITSCFVALMYIYLNIRKVSNATIFLALCLGGALVANWIRIVVIIMIGHYTDMQSPIIEDHNNLGWFIYIPYLALLMWAGRSLSDYQPSKPVPGSSTKVELSKHTVTALALTVLLLASPLSFDLLTTGQSRAHDLSKVEGQSFSLVNVASQQTHSLETQSGQALEVIASFTGPGFDSKASFFEQQLPKDIARAEYSIVGEQIHLVAFRYQGNHWLLAYQYEIDGQHPSQRSQLVKQQFKQAFKGKRGSQIRLLELSCNEDCQPLIDNISQYFP